MVCINCPRMEAGSHVHPMLQLQSGTLYMIQVTHHIAIKDTMRLLLHSRRDPFFPLRQRLGIIKRQQLRRRKCPPVIPASAVAKSAIDVSSHHAYTCHLR
jgi:hypothetical protein